MKFVNYEAYFLDDLSVDLLKRCEFAGRTCYASRDKITEKSYEDFIRKIIKSGHESVLEHRMLSFFVKCDRATMAELTRHRNTAFSVQSTRYVNGIKHGLEFVIPHWADNKTIRYAATEFGLVSDIGELSLDVLTNAHINENLVAKTPSFSLEYKKSLLSVCAWVSAMRCANQGYMSLSGLGCLPEDARGILPNDLATEMVVSCNLRELRHILKLRTSKAAHPNIRRIFKKLLDDLRKSDIKVLVEDIAD